MPSKKSPRRKPARKKATPGAPKPAKKAAPRRARKAAKKASPRRSSSRTSPHLKKRAVLAALALTGNVSEACRCAKVDRGTHYDWQKQDEAYAAAARDALEMAADSMELEARRRAVDGVLEPVYYGGKKVGKIRRYSDTLLIFLLKAARPEKFRERFEHSGPGGTPLAAPSLTVQVKS